MMRARNTPMRGSNPSCCQRFGGQRFGGERFGGERPGAAAAGFTMIEVMVAAGVLFVLLTMLTQLLINSTEVFSSGERGQEIVQRTQAALVPLQEAIEDLAGPTQTADGRSDARLLLQWMRLGGAEGGPPVQVLRSSVRINALDEARMAEVELLAAARQQTDDDQQAQQLLRRMVGDLGLKGRADMMLLPWPQGDAEGAYIEMRRCRRIPGRPLPFAEADGRGLLAIDRPGGPQLPAKYLVELCDEVLASGLLHFEVQLWSQNTKSWTSYGEQDAPEWVWDSARAGLLLDGKSRRDRFALDLGPISANVQSDDVYPRKARWLIVVGDRPDATPDGMLARDIDAGDTEIALVDADRLPDPVFGNLVKIGSEWVRFASIRGRRLTGCQRGQRRTTAKAHERGTGVRVGRTVVKIVPLPFGRDSWNG